MRRYSKYGLIVWLWAIPMMLFAQQVPKPSQSAARDTIQKITIDFADVLELLQQKNDLIQRLLGNVELRQDSIFMYCDSAVITNSTQLVAQGNVIIQQGDSLSIFQILLITMVSQNKQPFLVMLYWIMQGNNFLPSNSITI